MLQNEFLRVCRAFKINCYLTRRTSRTWFIKCGFMQTVCILLFWFSLFSTASGEVVINRIKRWWHIFKLLYYFGFIDNVECDMYVEVCVITVNLAGMLLMPVMWCDLYAWLSAVETIWNMSSVLCLLLPFPRVIRVLQRLIAFSDGTMCYLLFTTAGLLSTSDVLPSVCPSCLLCPFLFFHIYFSHFLSILEPSAMLSVQKVRLSWINRAASHPIPNNWGICIHLTCPSIILG